ncbi:MAG: ATP-dependent helicase [Phycisphaeraceae bacterium]|nr:ATP-dependent helicase [Phycisphaeraceae bacterium]MCB9847350.1 ATP-dependent helicase [Phycisphaeraceae bacterium]
MKTTTDQPAFLTDLDDDQRAAVLHDGGPCAVLAGPGAGKTRVIIHRLRRLLAPPEEGGLGAAPESIVAIAFTNKSAIQLRDRLAEAVSPSVASRVQVATSHAFGRRLLDRFADTIDLPPTRTVCDSAQRRRLMRSIMMSSDALKDRRAEGIESLITLALRFAEQCRTDGVEPTALVEYCRSRLSMIERGEVEFQDGKAEEAERARLGRDIDLGLLCGEFRTRRLDAGLLTLDDYINLPAKILREQTLPAAIIHDEIRHVVVDEFQDWNPSQIELLARLIPGDSGGAPGPDLFVVGDDDQSIYAWRGADDRAFERFARRWPGATTLTLARNYRSAPIIVETGNAIIEGVQDRFAPDKHIEPSPGWGVSDGRAAGSLEGVIVDDNADTGLVIAAMITEDRARREQEDGEAPRFAEYAVITRAQAEVDAVANELEIAGIPVDARRKATPLDDDAVQDLLSWMRLLDDPGSRPDAQRLLLRPPLAAPTEDVESWVSTHRQLAFQMREAAPTLLEWLRAEHGDHESVAWLLERFDAFRARAALGERADTVIEAVIREASLAHAEGLDGRQRARRIENLVRILRFVRRVTPNLDQPRGLREFWRYYNDLDEKEQEFETQGEGSVDPTEEDRESGINAVTVITAHSAKGLEFDTVFLPKVRPVGYPSTDRSDGEDVELPQALTGRTPTPHADEERRVFYVACTRAERRLVLIAKAKKGTTRGGSGDYYIELTQDHPELHLHEHAGATWLESLGSDPHTMALGGSSDEPASIWLRRQRERTMLGAVSDLHRATSAGVTAEQLESISADLRARTALLASIEHWRATGKAPSLRFDEPAIRAQLEAIDERMSRGDFADRPVTRPMKGPLHLSYSMIRAYLDCPRCFYLKYVLRLDELKTPQLEVGNIIHNALEWHAKASATAEADGLPAPGVDALVERALTAARRQLTGDEGDEGRLEQIEAQLRRYAQDFNDDAQLLEAEMRVTMPWTIEGAGQPHELTAKIDRVDLLPSGAHRIVDYKTGRASKTLAEPKKDDLQLNIYLLALMHAMSMDEIPEGAAEYWLLATGDRGVLPFAAMKLDKARQAINDAARGMLAGEFGQGKHCKGLCGILDG